MEKSFIVIATVTMLVVMFEHSNGMGVGMGSTFGKREVKVLCKRFPTICKSDSELLRHLKHKSDSELLRHLKRSHDASLEQIMREYGRCMHACVDSDYVHDCLKVCEKKYREKMGYA